jgi:hypothetical protein
MKHDKRARLAGEALQLKKARLVAAAVIGVGPQLTQREATIPNYLTWKNKVVP